MAIHGSVKDCPVCMEQYYTKASRVPKTLDCDHTLCLGCAERLVKARGIECPLCRQVTGVQTDDHSRPTCLPVCAACSSTFQVRQCDHCEQELCTDCRDEHVPNTVLHGTIVLARATYCVCYYLVWGSYLALDALIYWLSRLFTKVGVGVVVVLYIYLAVLLGDYLVTYVNDRIPSPCILPWGYDRHYWYSAQFDLPWQVAVSAQGHVVVSDLKRNSVTDLKHDFQYDLVIDAEVGRGLAVDNYGNTFVTAGRDVHVFDSSSGKHMARILLQGNFDMLRGIAVHRGFLYACAGNGFNVLKTNGSHVMRYNLPTTPQFIAIGPHGDIVISEAAGSVVIYRQKLPDMNQLHLMKEIHSVWLGPGFSTPGGLVVDCDGNIIVTDEAFGRLVKFNNRGEFDSYVQDGKEFKLKKPQSVALSIEGDILVADHGLGLVVRLSSPCRYNSLFRLLGVPVCSVVPG